MHGVIWSPRGSATLPDPRRARVGRSAARGVRPSPRGAATLPAFRAAPAGHRLALAALELRGSP